MKKLLLLIAFLTCAYNISYSQCTPSVQIFSDISVACSNSPVTFTAIPTNGGTAPLYEWFIGNMSQGSPTSNATYTTFALNGSNNTVSVKMTSNASCASPLIATSNSVTINIYPPIFPGSISADMTICYNNPAPKITEINTSTAIIPTYTWEQTTTPGTSASWVPATGTTSNGGKDFLPAGNLTTDMYYRRKVQDPASPAPCDIAYSTPVKITVLPDVVAGAISGNQTICESTTPATIQSIALPTGGQSAFTYLWESSTAGAGGPFSPALPAGTNATYAPGNLTTTTYYRRKEINSCGTVFSNIITKTVTASTAVSVTINNPPVQTCAGTPITFTATQTGGGATPVYQWYIDASTITGATTSTYTHFPIIFDNGKLIRVKVTSSDVCNTGPATSMPVTLDIVDAQTPTVSIQTSNNPNCAGLANSFSSIQTGTGLTPTYQWVVNAVPVGTGGTTFVSPSLVNGDQVWLEMTSSLSCIIGPNPIVSNKITMVIKPIPSPIINESDKTICAGNNFTFNATVGIGTTYQWHRYISGSTNVNNTAIPGATNSTYTATQTGQYSLTENNGVCNTTSDPVTLTIDPCGAFSTSILGPNPIIPGQLAAVYSVFNQAGFSYLWSVTGGTIVSGQNTNSVTVDWDASAASAVSRIATPVYSISVTETNTNNQKKTTTIGENPIATSISKSLTQSGITLFPNPTTESFNIEMPESGVAVSYEILDLTGDSVAKGSFISTGTAEQISANFGAGMYQVVLRYNDVVTSGRLSKVQ